ncbi:uncharacterized protein LOC134292632 [Anolis carolinensis]|uniref:uncharacterized protein LOC134292632 n=1 Tax=Anolis carolinensis TaxID=28377 RepID=UPI002F2B32DD
MRPPHRPPLPLRSSQTPPPPQMRSDPRPGGSVWVPVPPPPLRSPSRPRGGALAVLPGAAVTGISVAGLPGNRGGVARSVERTAGRRVTISPPAPEHAPPGHASWKPRVGGSWWATQSNPTQPRSRKIAFKAPQQMAIQPLLQSLRRRSLHHTPSGAESSTAEQQSLSHTVRKFFLMFRLNVPSAFSHSS